MISNSLKESSSKVIYRVTFIPGIRVDGHNGENMPLKKFEGVLENFYPGGKTVFFNENDKSYLEIQYSSIRDMYPIKKYSD